MCIMPDPNALTIRNLTKEFGGVSAVENASFDIAGGEIVALLGENGAGKSTLMKVVAGVYPSGTYSGELALGGEQLRLRNVKDAESRGIILVPQELHIAPNLSIAENTAMGALPGRFGVVSRGRLRMRALECLDFFGLKADPWRRAGTLSASEQRLMTIAAALTKGNPKILILDEPTASLTDGEAQHLYDKIRQVSRAGVATILITHRLDEVEGICSRAVVMRNGRVVLRSPDVKGRHGEFVRAMIGRDPAASSERHKTTPGKALLDVSRLKVHGIGAGAKPPVEDVSVKVRSGEIVGLFGLVGAGRSELARAIFGAWAGKVSGDVTICGVAGRPRSPREAIARRLAMLTEDRKRSGIIEGQSILRNISAASIAAVSSFGIIRRSSEFARNMGLARQLDLRPLDLGKPIQNLSGGNQQKALIARWLATSPDMLIVDEPTYGVDIGARQEIYRVLRQLAGEGKGILLISSDLEEIVKETDRVVVMYKGRVAGEFSRGVSRHRLMASATGQTSVRGGGARDA